MRVREGQKVLHSMKLICGNQKEMNHGKFVSVSLLECPLGKSGRRMGCLRSEQIGRILITMFNFPMTVHCSHWTLKLSEHSAYFYDTFLKFLNSFIYQTFFYLWERREVKKNINIVTLLAVGPGETLPPVN